MVKSRGRLLWLCYGGALSRHLTLANDRAGFELALSNFNNFQYLSNKLVYRDVFFFNLG